jgi:hypothetical protein
LWTHHVRAFARRKISVEDDALNEARQEQQHGGRQYRAASDVLAHDPPCTSLPEKLRAMNAVDWGPNLEPIRLLESTPVCSTITARASVHPRGRCGHQQEPVHANGAAAQVTSASWETPTSRYTAGGSQPQEHPQLQDDYAGSGDKARTELPLHENILSAANSVIKATGRSTRRSGPPARRRGAFTTVPERVPGGALRREQGQKMSGEPGGTGTSWCSQDEH